MCPSSWWWLVAVYLAAALLSGDAARAGGRGPIGGKARPRKYGSRVPVVIQHRNPASVTYYEHKDVSYYYQFTYTSNFALFHLYIFFEIKFEEKVKTYYNSLKSQYIIKSNTSLNKLQPNGC